MKKNQEVYNHHKMSSNKMVSLGTFVRTPWISISTSLAIPNILRRVSEKTYHVKCYENDENISLASTTMSRWQSCATCTTT